MKSAEKVGATPIHVLCLTPVLPAQHAGLTEAGYVLYDHSPPELRNVAPPNAASYRAVITNGSHGITGNMISWLPNLEIICAMAAGFEHIDLAAADERGIVVTHGPGTNSTAVADHAIALMFASARGIVSGDAATRRDDWQSSRRPRPLVVGSTVGIFGLGRIGLLIAKRLSGFDVEILYHSRSRRDDVPYTFVPTLKELAQRSDYLILAAPGGAATFHSIDADILDALGPEGHLINIARGSLVATDVLAKALREKRIGGAAIDVFEGEPHLPDALKGITDNLILTPHMAGAAREARAAIAALMQLNLDRHFAGEAVVTAVPRDRSAGSRVE